MNLIINCLFVGLGGAIGSIGRYLIGMIPFKLIDDFPMMTLLTNILGAFCIGLIVAIAGRRADFDPHLMLLLKVGFCGGFTTFSTFSNESLQLFQNGRAGLGLIYVLLSVILCVLAVFGAQQLVK